MKKLAMILVLSLILSCVGGLFASAEEPVTIRFLATQFVNAELSNETPTIKELEKRLNVKFDFSLSAANATDYAEAFNLMLASGDYPDIMLGTNELVGPYLDTGIFQELTDILPEKMPNVLSELEKYDLLSEVKADDGKIWYVPKIEGSTRMWEIDWINKAWLDELNLQIPTTTDELYVVLKAFKENKGPDIIPMTIGPWGDKLHSMYVAFGTWPNWYMFDKESGMEYGPYDRAEEMRKCLAFLNKLYAEDLLDHEYLTRNDDSINALIANNQSGYFYAWADDASRLQKGGTLGVDYAYVKPLKGPDGHEGWYKASSLSNRFYIASNSKIKEKLYEVINYIYSEEGRLLFTWGIEGLSYNVVDGKKVFVDSIMTDPAGPLDGRRKMGTNPVTFIHVSEWDGWAGVLPELVIEIAEVTADTANPIQPNLAGTSDEETQLANYMQDIQKYVDSQLPLFVNGSLNTESDFDAFIEQMKRMGIEEAKAIKDAQFERYLGR